MLHKISQFCDKIDGLKRDADIRAKTPAKVRHVEESISDIVTKNPNLFSFNAININAPLWLVFTVASLLSRTLQCAHFITLKTFL